MIVGIPLLASGDEIRHAERPSTYGIGLAFMWLQGAAFVFCIKLISQWRHFRRINKFYALIVFGTFIFTTLSGYRWIAILYILVPIVSYHYLIKPIELNARIKKLVLRVIVISFLLAFISYIGYRRWADDEAKYLRGISLMNISHQYKYVAPFFLSLQTPIASFSYLIKKVPDVHPYMNGKFTLAQVPGLSRSFQIKGYENPSIYITNSIFDLDFRNGHGSTAIGILGNFYIDGGKYAILIGTFAVGFMFTLMYYYMVNVRSLFSLCIYSFLVWTTVKWILVGFYFGDLRLALFMSITSLLVSGKNRSKVAV
jgi:oligosaccharide repeat unit polymerase